MHTITVCENEFKEIFCPTNYEIKIQNALYGRFDQTTCSHIGNRHFGDCSSINAVLFAKRACDGQIKCVIEASNTFFGDDPCVGTIKYAVISYTCELS